MIPWPPANRQPAGVSKRDDTAPATSSTSPPPATYQPATEQEAHRSWFLPDLVRAVLGQLLPFAAVLLCSYRVSQWLALGLALAWWGHRRLTRPRTSAPSRVIARRLR